MVRLLVAALVQDTETRTLAAGAANDVADAPTTKRTLLQRIAATCARWMGSGQREVIVLPLTTIYTSDIVCGRCCAILVAVGVRRDGRRQPRVAMATAAGGLRWPEVVVVVGRAVGICMGGSVGSGGA